MSQILAAARIASLAKLLIKGLNQSSHPCFCFNFTLRLSKPRQRSLVVLSSSIAVVLEKAIHIVGKVVRNIERLDVIAGGDAVFFVAMWS